MNNVLLSIMTTLIVLLTPVATHSITPKTIMTLKKGISAVGTMFGVGIPLGLNAYGIVKGIRDNNQNRTTQIKLIESKLNCKIREPNEVENSLLQSCIGDTTIPFRIITENTGDTTSIKGVRLTFDAFTDGKEIFIDEAMLRLLTINSSPSIDEKIKKARATVQHEAMHIKLNHILKRRTFHSTVLLGTTGAIAGGFKKYFRINPKASMARHIGRFFIKTLIGPTLALLLTETAMRKYCHHTEFQADQGIAPENRDAYIKHLHTIDTENQKLLNSLPLDEKISLYLRLTEDHHLPKERITRLQKYTKKA